jgi:hypothetical protein
MWANFQRIIELFTQKIVTKPSKIWDWDPGSGKNLFRIPDQGVKKAPDPGSGSATLVSRETIPLYGPPTCVGSDDGKGDSVLHPLVLLPLVLLGVLQVGELVDLDLARVNLFHNLPNRRRSQLIGICYRICPTGGAHNLIETVSRNLLKRWRSQLTSFIICPIGGAHNLIEIGSRNLLKR